MSKLVVFKTNSFPNISETFIVSNIVASIDKGYSIAIIVDNINSKANTSQSNLLEQYSLFDKLFKFSKPVGRKNRITNAIRYLFNPIIFYYYIKYSFYKGDISLDYIFTLKFYSNFRKAIVHHVHFATACYPLFELKEIGFLKSKIIVTFHGHDEHNLLFESRELKETLLDFSKHVAHITSNSKFLKDRLIFKGFDESIISIIPIGINTDYFSDNYEIKILNDPIKIITVGRFVEFKGQLTGVKVIKLLIERGYNIKYTLVGEGGELEKVLSFVKELNLQDCVNFLGPKSQNEIKNLLTVNSLFLVPSTADNSGRCETFGVVSLEAQSLGLPVIGFKSGGFPETLIENKTGFTVEDKDIVAMADCIEKLINQPKLYKEMSSNAKAHIRFNFNLRKTNQLYINLYEANNYRYQIISNNY